MYEFPFYIHEPVSNNAFSFEARREHYGKDPSLYVPALADGTLDDLQEGRDVAFEDYDDGELKSCRGLSRFIRMKSPFSAANVYVFDNHNHAFSFWALEKLEGRLSSPALIVHVDQHRDTRVPERMPSAADISSEDSIARYANTALNVGNFIPPAIEAGIANGLVHIGSEAQMDGFAAEELSGKRLILDIDLDFFAPELDYIANGKKIDFIRRILPSADVVTAATSPFFIEQSRAISFLKDIFYEKNS